MSPDATNAPRRVLIVANRTAATPMLLEQVRRRASEEACLFRLLVPRAYWDADTEESAVTLEFAIALLEDAAGGRVEGLVGDQDPFVAASAALQAGSFDEVIVSTLPVRVSHWLRIDLPTCRPASSGLDSQSGWSPRRRRIARSPCREDERP